MALREVAPGVQKHVGEGVSHLARCPEHMVVEAAVEHGAGTSEDPVHGAREPCPNALHAPRQRFPATRLDDQMHVVALERVVGDAELSTLAALRQ